MDSDTEHPEAVGSSEEIKRLKRDNYQLRADLENYRSQLLDILFTENDIPEQDIKGSFERIFTGIEDWIDEASSAENFQTMFRNNYLETIEDTNGKCFDDLGFDSGSPYHRNLAWFRKLGKLDTCYRVIISLVISKFLIDDMFRKEKTDELGNLYPHGLSKNDIDVLARIQRDMRVNLKRGMFVFPHLPQNRT